MFTEDLDAYFADFGIASTLQGGSAGGVMVIFDRAALAELGVQGTSPQALAKASAVADGDEGKTLTIDGTAYVIDRRDPIDDGAFVLLQLGV